MSHRALGLVVLVAACASHASVQNVKGPSAGISIALYQRSGSGYAVVDDRRWVEITGRSILLANIDPGAALASLVLEASDPALRIGTCMRERLPSPPPSDEPLSIDPARMLELRRLGTVTPPRPVPPPSRAPAPRVLHDESPDRFAPVVRCEVSAKPGRYLLRIVYVTTRLGYRGQHDIALSETTHARLISRFAITTPPWGQRAEIVLYDGAPGAERAPREVARGTVALDGSVSVLSVAPREIAAQVRRVYDGAIINSDDTNDAAWGHDSTAAVWVWLELAQLHLAPGPVHVHLELAGEGVRDIDVPDASRRQADGEAAPLRLPLWIDEALRGTRQRLVEYTDGVSLSERVMLGVANLGEIPREVWLEEHMRPASKRRLERAWPKKPTPVGDILRSKVEVRPGRIERTGYTLVYIL